LVQRGRGDAAKAALSLDLDNHGDPTPDGASAMNVGSDRYSDKFPCAAQHDAFDAAASGQLDRGIHRLVRPVRETGHRVVQRLKRAIPDPPRNLPRLTAQIIAEQIEGMVWNAGIDMHPAIVIAGRDEAIHVPGL